MLFEPVNLSDQKAKIVVLGVGGGGGNAINRMIVDGLNSVEFIAINTDAQDLENNNSQIKLQIGRELTKGLGAGANSEIGKLAVEENKEVIIKALDGADMVFITAGMGGGTGTGAAPEIAKLSKEIGALTVGIVTKPFSFEGPKRMDRANDGIKKLKETCDTLLAIPNQTLLEITDNTTTVSESFKLADSILHQATKGISDLINEPGLINLDFADVKTIMKNMGDAMMGTGVASGQERAILAAQGAIASPLLQKTTINGSKGLLVNITGPENMTLHELNDASKIIYDEAGTDANVILGCVIDKKLNDEVKITVIATGLNQGDYSGTILNRERNNYINTQTLDEKIPSYLDNKEQKTNNSKTETKNRHSSDNSDSNIKTFGEEYEIPTFLRRNNESS